MCLGTEAFFTRQQPNGWAETAGSFRELGNRHYGVGREPTMTPVPFKHRRRDSLEKQCLFRPADLL